MDQGEQAHSGLEPRPESSCSFINRPGSRLSTFSDSDRPLSPSSGSEWGSRPSTPVHLKRSKRQAPKPPSKLIIPSPILSDTVKSEEIDIPSRPITDMDISVASQASPRQTMAMSRPYSDLQFDGRCSPVMSNTLDNQIYSRHKSNRAAPPIPPLAYKCTPSVGGTPYQIDHTNTSPQLPGMSRVVLRLIDDDEEPENPEASLYISEEANQVHAKLSATSLGVTSTTTTSVSTMPTPLVNSNQDNNSKTSPSTVLYTKNSNGGFSPIPEQSVLQHFNGVKSPNNENELPARRGRARRLMHSSSDPGVGRSHHVGLAKVPQMCSPTPPPLLEQLSEVEDESESGAFDQSTYSEPDSDLHRAIVEDKRQCRLQRSDSMVTVAHLYEDLMVTPGIRVRVTLTNLTAVVVIAAFIMPNTATLLYIGFRYILAL